MELPLASAEICLNTPDNFDVGEARPIRFQRLSSDVSVLLRCANAMRGTAFGIAESVDVNVQLSKFANESAAVHSQ